MDLQTLDVVKQKGASFDGVGEGVVVIRGGVLEHEVVEEECILWAP